MPPLPPELLPVLWLGVFPMPRGSNYLRLLLLLSALRLLLALRAPVVLLLALLLLLVLLPPLLLLALRAPELVAVFPASVLAVALEPAPCPSAVAVAPEAVAAAP